MAVTAEAKFITDLIEKADVTTVLATVFVIMGVYLALVVAAGTSLTARSILFKSSLFARSVAHLFLSNEKARWPKDRPDPDVVKDMKFVAVKRVIFVRWGGRGRRGARICTSFTFRFRGTGGRERGRRPTINVS